MGRNGQLPDPCPPEPSSVVELVVGYVGSLKGRACASDAKIHYEL